MSSLPFNFSSDGLPFVFMDRHTTGSSTFTCDYTPVPLNRTVLVEGIDVSVDSAAVDWTVIYSLGGGTGPVIGSGHIAGLGTMNFGSVTWRGRLAIPDGATFTVRVDTLIAATIDVVAWGRMLPVPQGY